MEGHAKNVWEDIANWQIKQFKNFTMSQRYALTSTNLKKKKKKKWNPLRIVKSMRSNRSEVLVLGTY